MTAVLSRMRSHFAHWREWELNPIVIKELRQGVRSWTVTGMLLLFLVVLFIASLGFLITESLSVNASVELGGRMFTTFVVILAGASVFFIPLYTGVRVASERQANGLDLLYVSTLSPARIILGKFLCSAYIVLLFFSACMPFMAFTSLLRGVDMPTVLFILAFLFLIVCAANLVAIFLACLPASRPFKVLFAIAGFFLSFWIILPIGFSFFIMRSGIGSMMSDPNFWIRVFLTALLAVGIGGLFFVLSVALISPPSANRAWPVRLYLTACWLLGGGLALGWCVRTGQSDGMGVWTYSTFALLVPALLVTISNSDQFSFRVRRKIPGSRLKRWGAFLCFNGAAGGLCWLVLLALATGAIAFRAMARLPGGALDDDDWRKLITLALYVFAYSLTALFLHRTFFPQRPAKLAGLLAVLLVAGWALLPPAILFFINELSWKTVDSLQLGNIFNVEFNRDSGHVVYHEYFAAGWLLLAVALNLKWFLRQLQNFHPPAAAEPAPPAERPA
jgi:hypothetical protein